MVDYGAGSPKQQKRRDALLSVVVCLVEWHRPSHNLVGEIGRKLDDLFRMADILLRDACDLLAPTDLRSI